MIRAARMTDVPRLVELLEEQHAHSKYAGVVGVDNAYARKLIAAYVQRHGGVYDGSSFVMVDEVDGVIEAFVAGVLTRVYEIGDKLAANDAFLVATERAPAPSFLRLLDEYLGWASANANVHEIRLSWTDALPQGERMGPVYARKGFRQCGAIFERVNDAATAQEAA